MTNPERSRQRRQRRLYAAIAGWTLLGAASTGIVACSNADAAETAAGAGTTSSAAASPSSTTPGGSGATNSSAASSVASSAATSGAATSSAAAAASSTAEATTAASTSTYKDGSYTASGSYSSPGGTESVSITLTLTGDTITGASAVGEATGGPSEQYQSEFVSNFAAMIVGKDIDSVSLDKVAGSSLTSSGFNAAVETIKSDALA